MTYGLGVDIGGTFTDCIIVNDEDGAVGSIKVPSQPATPDKGVLEGVGRLLKEYEVSAQDIGHFGHGTTLATNTVIEQTGEQVGLIVTRGFRDVVFLARLRFPEPTNLKGRLPSSLLPRRNVYEVTERITADGEVVTTLQAEEVLEAARELLERRQVKAIVVSYLHSYRNPVHERQTKELLEKHFPGLYVSISSEVWPRPREYERTMVSVMNAYVGERMRRYLTGLSRGAAEAGIKTPVLVTKSNGGIMNTDTAGDFPIQTMLSGPAAGVVGARHVAQQAGHGRIVTWDMGGTSLDVSVIEGDVRYSDNARVGDYPLFIPTVDVLSIGAGGGSIGWVDPSGMLHVGPRSAGAEPGPACYDRGGVNPTLTDAYLTLGIIDPDYFAGGGLTLKPELAEKALRRLGESLTTDTLGAAEAMVKVATAQMYAEFVPLSARYGISPEEFTLLPYGGAGPTHAFLFAREANFRQILVPPFPGLLCAWGALIADLRFDVPAAIHARLEDLDEEDFNAQLEEMGHTAANWLAEQGVAVERVQIVRQAYVRYQGQSFEVETPLPAGRVTRDDLREAFLQAYERRYGYVDPVAPLEVIEVLVQCIGATQKPVRTPASLGARAAAKEARTKRRVYFDGEYHLLEVVQRGSLVPGDELRGPVIIEQADTTTFVPSGFQVKVDPHLNLVGKRR